MSPKTALAFPLKGISVSMCREEKPKQSPAVSQSQGSRDHTLDRPRELTFSGENIRKNGSTSESSWNLHGGQFESLAEYQSAMSKVKLWNPAKNNFQGKNSRELKVKSSQNSREARTYYISRSQPIWRDRIEYTEHSVDTSEHSLQNTLQVELN